MKYQTKLYIQMFKINSFIIFYKFRLITFIKFISEPFLQFEIKASE
jgi:hypothetical protein